MFIKSVKYREKERILSQALSRVKKMLPGEQFLGNAPAPFVGRFGYPRVSVGILAPPIKDDGVWVYDAPRFWSGKGYGISEIVQLRASLINSCFRTSVKQPDKLVEIAREVAMASKPVELEFSLKKPPQLAFKTSNWVAPMGPQALVQKVVITSNPKIPLKVQKVFDDADLKAVEAVTGLFSRGFDENALARMFSVGVFGVERRLVPTRWSITAVDDILGKHLIGRVRDFEICQAQAYFGGYLGNYYLVLFLPRRWSYELFELYTGRASRTLEYSTDCEGFEGRKGYAENCAGGYYSVRLAVAEKLFELKRQAGVLVFRFITDEYVLPLGVWVTREAARKALAQKPIVFASTELLLKHARDFVRNNFGLNLDELLKKSKLLQQKTLTSFF